MKRKSLSRIITKYKKLISDLGQCFDMSASDIAELIDRTKSKSGSIADQFVNAVYDSYRLGFIRGYAAGIRKDRIQMTEED